MIPLTEIAQDKINPGHADIVIDATAGNGHDTLFLAQRVGSYGKVYAFDIQKEALVRTEAQLAAAGLTNVRLIHDDHANMANVIEPVDRGRVACVMFNLGYLPRGDKTVITQPSSTCAAIEAAARLLLFGGRMTILAYPGHPGGFEEMEAVEQTLARLSPMLSVRWFHGDDGPRVSPRLYVATKIAEVGWFPAIETPMPDHG